MYVLIPAQRQKKNQATFFVTTIALYTILSKRLNIYNIQNYVQFYDVLIYCIPMEK